MNSLTFILLLLGLSLAKDPVLKKIEIRLEEMKDVGSSSTGSVYVEMNAIFDKKNMSDTDFFIGCVATGGTINSYRKVLSHIQKLVSLLIQDKQPETMMTPTIICL